MIYPFTTTCRQGQWPMELWHRMEVIKGTDFQRQVRAADPIRTAKNKGALDCIFQ